MHTTFTYEGILRAVGRMLDESGVKSISIHEDENGLVIEGKNSAGQSQLHLRYDVEDIYHLVMRQEAPEEPEIFSREDGAELRRLLASHSRELVGATR